MVVTDKFLKTLFVSGTLFYYLRCSYSISKHWFRYKEHKRIYDFISMSGAGVIGRSIYFNVINFCRNSTSQPPLNFIKKSLKTFHKLLQELLFGVNNIGFKRHKLYQKLQGKKSNNVLFNHIINLFWINNENLLRMSWFDFRFFDKRI